MRSVVHDFLARTVVAFLGYYLALSSTLVTGNLALSEHAWEDLLLDNLDTGPIAP